MKMKPLGHSGIEVSAVGLGCMNFGMMCDQDATTAIVDAALDTGVNFFDVAAIYGGPHGKAEALLGTALGLPLDQVIYSPSTRPFTLASKGKPVVSLFG